MEAGKPPHKGRHRHHRAMKAEQSLANTDGAWLTHHPEALKGLTPEQVKFVEATRNGIDPNRIALELAKQGVDLGKLGEPAIKTAPVTAPASAGRTNITQKPLDSLTIAALNRTPGMGGMG